MYGVAGLNVPAGEPSVGVGAVDTMGLAADVGAGAVVGVLEGALVDTGRRVLRRGEQAASTPEPADIAPRSSARREVSSVIGASLPVVSGQSALHRDVGEAETPLMQNATLEGRPSPVRSHSERLRRRGFRMMMFSAIAAPLLFVALVFGALGYGFCGDRISSEVDSCEASAQQSIHVIEVLLALAVAMFAVGLVVRLRGSWVKQSEEHISSGEHVEIRSGRARWAVAVAGFGFGLMILSRLASPFGRFFLDILVLILGSAATLIGWRSFDTPPGASLDRRSRLLADVAVVGGLVSVAVVLVPGIARWL